MNRKREQVELFLKLGQLFGPLLKMAEQPTSYDSDERNRMLARYQAEFQVFMQEVNRFCNGEPGFVYGHIASSMGYQLTIIQTTAWHVKSDGTGFPALFTLIKESYKNAVDSLFMIPIPVDSTIHEARTPYTTHSLVRNFCSTARQRIVWMDRYFSESLFGRYFNDTPKETEIVLITYPQSKCQGARDRTRYADFLGVSKLFSMERPLGKYRLITSEDFHDRHLQIDDKMLALGGSIKDLGNDSTFTVSRLDNTPSNHQYFIDAITAGTELFGPTNTVHP